MILNYEYQVVCFNSSLRELKLGILKCKSGSSQHIFTELESLLNQFDTCKSLKMIICDTTTVNTGWLKGIVSNVLICFIFIKLNFSNILNKNNKIILKHFKIMMTTILIYSTDQKSLLV